MARNAQAGARIACQGCAQPLTVPPAPPPRRGRGWGKLVLLLLVLTIGAGGLYAWNSRTRAVTHVQDRFQERLAARSPNWQGLSWETCDPQAGDFRLTAHYSAPNILYTITLQRLAGMSESSIRVNPAVENWLAFLRIQHGLVLEAHYKGDSKAEKDELFGLAQDLDAALDEAIR